MTAIDLKYNIIDKLKNINDKSLLEELYKIISLDTKTTVLQLNKEQKTAIQKAQKQYLEGKYLTNEQAEKDIKKCLD